jgi:hypothetical protein
VSPRTPRTVLIVDKDGSVKKVIVLPETRSEWLWGHKEIGAYAGRNEWWSERQVKKGMPVSYISGRACITKLDLDVWLRMGEPAEGRT